MKLLHALFLFAGTGLAVKHPHANGKSSSSTSTSTQLSTMWGKPTATAMSSAASSAAAPTATSASKTTGTILIPGCNGTKEWTQNDDFPTVCQLRTMLKEQNATTLNNTIFLHDMMDLSDALLFAETLSKSSPKEDKLKTMISVASLDGGNIKTGVVGALIEKMTTAWSNVHDEFQVWKRLDQAIAMECSGTVYVITAEDVGIAEVAPFQNTSMSYFALFTYPALMENPKIDQVINVWKKTGSWDRWDRSNSTFGQKTLWKKGDNVTYTFYHADQDESQTYRIKARAGRLPKGNGKPTADSLPNCNSTKGWTSNDGVPSVCQIRKMIQQRNSSLHDILFVQNEFSVPDVVDAGVYLALDEPNFNAAQATNRVSFVRESKIVPETLDSIARANQTWTMVDMDQFARRFNQAVAMECSGTTYIYAAENVGIDETGVEQHTSEKWFALFDYPALMRNPKVEKVVQVWKKSGSSFFSKSSFGQKIIWKKGNKVTYPLHDADQDKP